MFGDKHKRVDPVGKESNERISIGGAIAIVAGIVGILGGLVALAYYLGGLDVRLNQPNQPHVPSFVVSRPSDNYAVEVCKNL